MHAGCPDGSPFFFAGPRQAGRRGFLGAFLNSASYTGRGKARSAQPTIAIGHGKT
jgi:hypothetical protein